MACETGNNEVDDIEDLVKESDSSFQRLEQREVVPKIKVPRGKPNETAVGANIPGTQSIYIKTWGCAHNASDGEYMAGQLSAYGYTITDDPNAADLWLLNSCTVKNPAQEHFLNMVKLAKEKEKYLVVAGCVPQAAPKHKLLQGISIVGVQQIDRVVEVVEETLKGHTVRFLEQKKEGRRRLGGAKLDLPKIRKNPLVEIIPISTGCLNQCTYCKTKHARGQLGSYPPEQIVTRAKQVIEEEGVVEIWLSSEDTGAYGRDIGTNLPELLWKLIAVLPEGTFLRVGMTNPPYILEHLEEMAKILSHPRVYSFLHIPVQAASDKVLRDMRREYTCAEFKRVVEFLRERVPGLTIATDIICGFPTETAEDFEETLALVRQYQFPVLFINQFYPRPGTPAAKMPRVPTNEVKRRSRELTHLFQQFHPYNGRVGERTKILVDDKAPDGIHYVGRTKAYEQVLIPKDKRIMGKLIEVEITEVRKFEMFGRVIEESIARAPVRPPPLPQGIASGVFRKRRMVKPSESSKELTLSEIKTDVCTDCDCDRKTSSDAQTNHQIMKNQNSAHRNSNLTEKQLDGEIMADVESKIAKERSLVLKTSLLIILLGMALYVAIYPVNVARN
jgi:threonylcarbamoyladenosine tRNA methylthiotransferase CDKAL1